VIDDIGRGLGDECDFAVGWCRQASCPRSRPRYRVILDHFGAIVAIGGSCSAVTTAVWMILSILTGSSRGLIRVRATSAGSPVDRCHLLGADLSATSVTV